MTPLSHVTVRPAPAESRLARWCVDWKSWSATDTKRARQRHRADVIRQRVFGIDADQWDELALASLGRCTLCLKPDDGTRAGLVIDHNHETKEVRGLLCHGCNTLEGKLSRLPRFWFNRLACYRARAMVDVEGVTA